MSPEHDSCQRLSRSDVVWHGKHPERIEGKYMEVFMAALKVS